MRKLLVFTAVPLLAVCLSLQGVQASVIGVPVPKPTATGQSITSSPAAPFTWTPVTLPYGLNATGQMAVGGTVDATTRLSVNPQGTAENGLTVNMPSGSTGIALQAKGTSVIQSLYLGNGVTSSTPVDGVIAAGGPIGANLYGANLILQGGRSTGYNSGGDIVFQVAPGNGIGGTALNTYKEVMRLTGATLSVNFANAVGFTRTAQATNWYVQTNYNNLYFGPNLSPGAAALELLASSITMPGHALGVNVPDSFVPNAELDVRSGSASTTGILFTSASGQTADLFDLNDSTNVVKAKVDSNFKATFTGLATTGSAVSTLAGGLSNSGYSVTNALSAPTGLAVSPVGTAGTTTYRYYVVAVSGTGTTTVSNEAVVTTANAALTSTNYNAVSWTATPGAESYTLYRTGGASGTEAFLVSGLTATTYSDYLGSITSGLASSYVETVATGSAGVIGTYTPVTGASATVNSATQYTNGADFLGYSPTGPSGAMWQITSAVNGGGSLIYYVVGTPTTMPLTGWTSTGALTPYPAFTAGAIAPLPAVNTTGYHNAASYQVGGVAGVTTTLADGSAVTKGIVTGVPKGTLTAISTKTAAYTVTVNDNTILMNGAFAVTLPAASAALAGHSWTVKQIGAASSTVVGTVDGNTAGYTLAAQYNFVTIVTDGVSYYITGKG